MPTLSFASLKATLDDNQFKALIEIDPLKTTREDYTELPAKRSTMVGYLMAPLVFSISNQLPVLKTHRKDYDREILSTSRQNAYNLCDEQVHSLYTPLGARAHPVILMIGIS